jgi:hypothetical protein
MLDEEHESLPQPPTDHNVYCLGSIGAHNVAIAGLHQPGNNPAATVVTQMRTTFPNLRFGLSVGIGGGVPVKTDNGMIRLGDVVVSKPGGEHSGAIQYDHGKAEAGNFRRAGALTPPLAVLLNAAQDLAAQRARTRKDRIAENIKGSTRPSEDSESIGAHVQHRIICMYRTTSIGIRESLAMSVKAILLNVYSVPSTVRTTMIHMWLSTGGQLHLVSWLSEMVS